MKKILYISLFLAFLTSCTVVNTVSIDYLQPADVSFPPGVKVVGVVNNTPQGDYVSKLEELNSNGSPASNLIGAIEGNGKTATEELANSVYEGNYFDEVIICDSALRSKDYFTRDTKLSQSEVKELTESLGVDMILSLKKVNLYLKKSVIYYEDAPFPQGVIDATVRTMTRVYVPTKSEPIVTLSDTDSIYWVTGTWNVDKSIIEEGSSFAATLPVKHILPTWKSVTRYYYASGAVEMRDAAVYVRENNWDEARKLWEQVYGRKNEKMKMRAAYNIALCCEMKDNLQEAKEWLDKAAEIAEKKVTKNEKGEVETSTGDYKLIAYYLADLTTRLSNIQKLKLQMMRFSGDF